MNETQESIVWSESEVPGLFSGCGRFHIERRADRYFDLYDGENYSGVPCNNKRLSLKACKALAEEIVAGEHERSMNVVKANREPLSDEAILNRQNEIREAANQNKPANSDLVEQLTDSTNALTEIDRELDEIEKLIQDKEDLVSSHELQSAEKVVELTEGHHFPGDPYPPGPDNLPKTPERREPTKQKTFSQAYGFNLSKILAPSMVPFRVLTMKAAESRTKTKSRGMKIEDDSLRGGTTAEVVRVTKIPFDPPKLKTREEVQKILNRLMVEKGTNVVNWSDFQIILKENGVDPADVKQGMIPEAEKWAREHAEEEAAKKRQPRQVALEHLKPGTTFRIPGMEFEVGVLLDKNPSAAKVRITQGCKDREIDWSLGTPVVVVGKVSLEKHRPSGDNETGTEVEDVLPPWETTEDAMKIRIDVAKKLLVALGLAATAVKKMSAKKVETKINNVEKHVEEAEKVEGENLKLLEKIIEWREGNADGTIKIVGGEDEESAEETETPAEEQEEETEQKEEDEVKETKEKAPKKGKKSKPEKAPKEVQEKPAKKAPKEKTEAKEEKKPKTGKAKVEGNGEARGRYEVLGHSVTAVIRTLGKEGWEFKDTKTALSNLGVECSDSTIRNMLRAGVKGDRGDPAPLTNKDFAELKKAKSS